MNIIWCCIGVSVIDSLIQTTGWSKMAHFYYKFSPDSDRNNFENRLIFDKVKAFRKLCHFLGHPVVSSFINREMTEKRSI